MKNIDSAATAAEQRAGDDAPTLATDLRNAARVSGPAAWRAGAGTARQARPGGRVPAGSARIRALGVAAKPGQPNIRKQHVHMTRVNANGEGGSGPYPLREQPA